MSFTLHFNSFENTELLDITVLAALGNCNESHKLNRLVFDVNFNQCISKLPTFIKHVEFGAAFKKDISDIGDHIESIVFQVEVFNYDLATFPKSLRKLKIAGYKINSKIENANPGLETLIIDSNNFNSEINLSNSTITSIEIVSDVFNQCLSHLPPGLKTLKINCNKFNSPINNLPPGLEYLLISSTIFNQLIDNLPSGLKTFILQNANVFMQPLNNLPHGLENFDLHLGYLYDNTGVNIYRHTLENLPNSIKKLVLSNYWGDLNTIVNSVVELDIYFPANKSKEVSIHIQHWKKLPSSLKILDVNKVLSIINKVHIMTDIIKTNINCSGIYLNGTLV